MKVWSSVQVWPWPSLPLPKCCQDAALFLSSWIRRKNLMETVPNGSRASPEKQQDGNCNNVMASSYIVVQLADEQISHTRFFHRQAIYPSVCVCVCMCLCACVNAYLLLLLRLLSINVIITERERETEREAEIWWVHFSVLLDSFIDSMIDWFLALFMDGINWLDWIDWIGWADWIDLVKSQTHNDMQHFTSSFLFSKTKNWRHMHHLRYISIS